MNTSSRPYHTTWKQTWRDDSGTLSARFKHDISVWLINLLRMYPLPANGDTVRITQAAVKRHPKVPRLRKRDGNRWMFPRSLAPVALHWLYCKYIGGGDTAGKPLLVFIWYFLWFMIIGTDAVRMWHQLGQEYGYLDGQKKRQGVPDDSTHKIFVSLIGTALGRSGLVTLCAYSPDVPPSLDWTLLIQLAMYPIILDFWFYVYHRALHEVPRLWKFHRTHHMTKHPNTLLTLFADAEQEMADIFFWPVLAYYTMRPFPMLSMSFYHWWICSIYQAVIELGGHSGVRIFAGTFTAGFGLLGPLGLDLVIEDHDLHHRKGYKRSGNYGKQTLVWDSLFRTRVPREECVDRNVAVDEAVEMPW